MVHVWSIKYVMKWSKIVVYHLRATEHLLNCSPIIFNNGNYIELPGFKGAEICGLISPNYRLSSCRGSGEAAGGSSSSSSKDGINFNSYGSKIILFDKMRAAVNIIYVTCEHRPSYIAM